MRPIRMLLLLGCILAVSGQVSPSPSMSQSQPPSASQSASSSSSPSQSPPPSPSSSSSPSESSSPSPPASPSPSSSASPAASPSTSPSPVAASPSPSPQPSPSPGIVPASPSPGIVPASPSPSISPAASPLPPQGSPSPPPPAQSPVASQSPQSPSPVRNLVTPSPVTPIPAASPASGPTFTPGSTPINDVVGWTDAERQTAIVATAQATPTVGTSSTAVVTVWAPQVNQPVVITSTNNTVQIAITGSGEMPAAIVADCPYNPASLVGQGANCGGFAATACNILRLRADGSIISESPMNVVLSQNPRPSRITSSGSGYCIEGIIQEVNGVLIGTFSKTSIISAYTNHSNQGSDWAIFALFTLMIIPIALCIAIPWYIIRRRRQAAPEPFFGPPKVYDHPMPPLAPLPPPVFDLPAPLLGPGHGLLENPLELPAPYTGPDFYNLPPMGGAAGAPFPVPPPSSLGIDIPPALPYPLW